jgi:hypothetical protein
VRRFRRRWSRPEAAAFILNFDNNAVALDKDANIETATGTVAVLGGICERFTNGGLDVGEVSVGIAVGGDMGNQRAARKGCCPTRVRKSSPKFACHRPVINPSERLKEPAG